jgi:hypothetical protein
MTSIHLDIVRAEHSTHLLQDRSPCHLHSVRLQDRVNVVGIDVVIFQDTLLRSRRKVPQPMEIGAIGC